MEWKWNGNGTQFSGDHPTSTSDNGVRTSATNVYVTALMVLLKNSRLSLTFDNFNNDGTCIRRKYWPRCCFWND
ncbi:hypothetical protein Csa_006517 [Cucumis sativus]|uniref:Uncharacterized protein n=1 Tax=Cucumis sativus TaxID=3659 RepID=A0A0A0LMZ4_CUCSA|nr:hypothetical protein Csa_006517 [Cucumis sativus]